MGEGFGAWRMGDDALAMPLIDQANLACGFHAGDPLIMARSVELAVAQGVSIGAHPSYPDLQGFGRRHLQCSAEEVRALVLYQIGALDAFCRAAGGQLAYVKPHGALYNDMMREPAKLRAVMRAVAAYDRGLPLMLMATRDDRAPQAMADELGLQLWFEVFADRAYDANGMLLARSLPGAVHHGAQTIVAQAVALARGEALSASDGSALYLRADTLCVHGDNAASVAAVQRIRAALQSLPT